MQLYVNVIYVRCISNFQTATQNLHIELCKVFNSIFDQDVRLNFTTRGGDLEIFILLSPPQTQQLQNARRIGAPIESLSIRSQSSPKWKWNERKLRLCCPISPEKERWCLHSPAKVKSPVCRNRNSRAQLRKILRRTSRKDAQSKRLFVYTAMITERARDSLKYLGKHANPKRSWRERSARENEEQRLKT